MAIPFHRWVQLDLESWEEVRVHASVYQVRALETWLDDEDGEGGDAEDGIEVACLDAQHVQEEEGHDAAKTCWDGVGKDDDEATEEGKLGDGEGQGSDAWAFQEVAFRKVARVD